MTIKTQNTSEHLSKLFGNKTKNVDHFSVIKRRRTTAYIPIELSFLIILKTAFKSTQQRLKYPNYCEQQYTQL